MIGLTSEKYERTTAVDNREALAGAKVVTVGRVMIDISEKCAEFDVSTNGENSQNVTSHAAESGDNTFFAC